MKTIDLHNTTDVVAMAERIFRGMKETVSHEAEEGERCPFTLESAVECEVRGDGTGQELCPFSLEKCRM